MYLGNKYGHPEALGIDFIVITCDSKLTDLRRTATLRKEKVVVIFEVKDHMIGMNIRFSKTTYVVYKSPEIHCFGDHQQMLGRSSRNLGLQQGRGFIKTPPYRKASFMMYIHRSC